MSKAIHEAALPPDGTQRALGAALRDFWSIGGAYWRGRGLAGAWGMGLALGVATLAHALIQLRLNLWLGEFFNAIDLRAGATLLRDLGLLALLALGLLLHKPEWVLIDEATSELDDAAEADMMALFKAELAGATLASTGRRPGLAAFHDRTLTLARSADGSHLVKG